MVTMTRDLERGLIAAGVPEEEARAIVDGLEVRLSDLATREDLERELTVFRTEMALRFEAMEFRDQAADKKIDDLKEDINRKLDDLNRTMWRIFMLMFTAGGALFGALMYSIFR